MAFSEIRLNEIPTVSKECLLKKVNTRYERNSIKRSTEESQSEIREIKNIATQMNSAVVNLANGTDQGEDRVSEL